VELKLKDPRITKFVRHFSTRSRKPVRVKASQSYYVTDYWDGGSRAYSCFVDTNTGLSLSDSEVGFELQLQSNPFKQRIGDVVLKPGVAVVENTIFCGKDLGLRIYLCPEDYAKLEAL
jgi:hypothetical protein